MMAAAQQRNLSVELRLPGERPMQLYAESYALVIGAAAYTNGWPRLGGVPADVRSVGAALRGAGFKVIEVMNPTLARLESSLRSFIAEHGQNPNNRLLIYFAGHGHTLKSAAGSQLGYLVPVDAPVPTERNVGAFKAAALSMDSIENLAKQIDAKHALFVFDSCFSGTFFKMRAAPESITLKTTQPVRQFITAGSADQPVPDVSVFRQQFLAGIKGEADLNGDGYVTGSELGMFLEDRVTNYSRQTQTPQYGKIRDPSLDKGDFVFALASAPARPAPAPSVAIDPVAAELSFWNDVKASGSADELNAYLATYPKGQFAELARARIKALAAPATPVAASPATTPAAPQLAAITTQPPRNLSVAPTIAPRDSRLALLIGNSGYSRNDALPQLKNPSNDARDIAVALKENGFGKVAVVLDADHRTMRDAISKFGEDLRKAGPQAVGLFYYAGHGVEEGGRNYLIPLGTRIGSPKDLEFDSIDAQRVLAYMEDAGNAVNIFVLDACRDNPFPQLNRFRSSPNRGGLAQMRAPTGTFIGFSAAPGQTAIEGDGRNSLFAGALVQSLRLPNSNIDAVFTRATGTVTDMTARRQVPWKQSSLTSDFHFRPN
jgi:uncharacterized caspase-like protein